ncbi:MAG TPA: RagB/SusD family nutrient uptake outer membrane protein, partial [Pedobacter sp.]
LDYAIDNAAGTSSIVNVNKWSAMALKMRVLLNRGQNDDYVQCAVLGNMIINSSPYALEATTRDIFYTKGLTSKEVMLGITPQANQGEYYYNTTGNYVKRSAYYVATAALNDLLAADPRKSWVIGDAGYYKKGFYFIKYNQPALTTTQLSEVAYAIRLSEVYLMTAEATVRSGGSTATAKTLLKMVMKNAGVTNFTAVDAASAANDVLLQLYYEYVRSFIGEDDQYYFALLRFPLAMVTTLRPTIKSTEQYIYPVPHSEFTSNPLIGDQNPGYAK